MRFRSSVVVITCFCLPSTLAFTQEDPDSPSSKLDEIIVSAARTPISRAAIGSSVTVIDRHQIEARQARYVSDLLRVVPGFSVSHSGGLGSQTQVRVRGAEANHVLVLLDGVRANDPAGGDEFRWEVLGTANIEKIEIVRGPQSSLWGSDAVAAVVNIITKSGSTGSTIGGFVEGGSESTLNTGIHGGTSAERWSLGFGVDRLDTDGTNVSRTGGESDGSDLTTASLSTRLKANDSLSFSFAARAVDAYSQFDPVDFFVTGLPTDGDVASDVRQTMLSAGGTLDTLDGRVVHQLRASYLDTDNENLVDGLFDSSTASSRTNVTYQADLGLGNNTLTLAVEHERTEFEQRGAVGFGDPNQDQKIDVTSFISEFRGDPVGDISWLASIRLDDNSDFDNAVTGRLAGSWQLTETTRIRGSVGSGQKAPTFTERFGFFPGQFVGNRALKPEYSTSYELGIEHQSRDSLLTLGLTLFHQDLEDEINGFVFDPDTFLFTAANVNGDSTRQGVELETTFIASERLELRGSYTYLDSTENNQGVETDELRRPRHSASFSGHYRFLGNRGSVLLVADYSGTRHDIFFPPFPQPSAIVALGNYWQLDLTAGIDVTDNTNVYVRVNNLLDENFEQVFGYRSAGLSALVGIRVDFGRSETQ